MSEEPEAPQEEPKPSRGDRVRPHQWKKGQSGNPSGKRKGTISITAHVKRLLAEGGEVQAKELAAAIIKEARKNPGILKEAWARVDGPLKTEIEASGALEIKVSFAPDNDPTPWSPHGATKVTE